jgi:hypothetical protein
MVEVGAAGVSGVLVAGARLPLNCDCGGNTAPLFGIAELVTPEETGAFA